MYFEYSTLSSTTALTERTIKKCSGAENKTDIVHGTYAYENTCLCLSVCVV